MRWVVGIGVLALVGGAAIFLPVAVVVFLVILGVAQLGEQPNRNRD